MYKLRITSDSPEDAEALRVVLVSIFGERLRLEAARVGRNPRYAGSSSVLAYGELSISPEELALLIERPAAPVTARAKRGAQ